MSTAHYLYEKAADEIKLLKAENARLKDALRFFANRESYIWVDIPRARVLAICCEEPWKKAGKALGSTDWHPGSEIDSSR